MSVLFRSDGWVKSVQGPAVPGAQIFVCTQPANAPSSLVPVSPSPQASIFSDSGGLVPITQPIITDGFGHYDFYAAPGLYTVLVYQNGLLQQTYPDQSVGGIGSGGGVNLVAGANITIVGSVISATGGTTLESEGTANPNQSILNLASDWNTGIYVAATDGSSYFNEYLPYTQVLQVGGTFNNPYANPVGTVTISNNVITVVTSFTSSSWPGAGARQYIAGQTLKYWFSGFQTLTFLNGQAIDLTCNTPPNSGLPPTFTGTFTHANVSTTTDPGLIAVPLNVMACYSGVDSAIPPNIKSSLSNTGALWVEPDSNFWVHTVKSTNGSDANWTAVSATPILIG